MSVTSLEARENRAKAMAKLATKRMKGTLPKTRTKTRTKINAKSTRAVKGSKKSLEEMCGSRTGYELVDMEDGKKSCRKKCADPTPTRSSSKSRKCIQGIVRVAASSTKKRIRKKRRESDSFIAEDDDELTAEQIADKDAAIKKVRQGNRMMKCLGEISTKELEEEIAQRKKEASVYVEQENVGNLRGKELLQNQVVTDVVTVQGKQKKRIAPTLVAAVRKE
jgi:hypothetical protein